MSTDTADHGPGRRRSDRAGTASTVEDDGTDEALAVDDDTSPLLPSQMSAEDEPARTALHGNADDLDDGTPDIGGESDASEADETDDPSTTPIARPPFAPVRGRRGIDGSVRNDGFVPRRRRSDELMDYEAITRRPRGRAGWIAATIVFVLLFGGAAALDYYLWNTSEQWETRAEALTEMNYDLGALLSSEQQTTLQLTSEIDLLTQQLATSNQKVTDLSAEKANAVDESAYYLQQIEALETDVSSASGVANALHRCVDGQQELITYLRDAESYEPEELEDFSESVRALCAEAESTNDRLQEALSE